MIIALLASFVQALVSWFAAAQSVSSHLRGRLAIRGALAVGWFGVFVTITGYLERWCGVRSSAHQTLALHLLASGFVFGTAKCLGGGMWMSHDPLQG